MAKLSSFLFLMLDGFLEGPGRDISWNAHEAGVKGQRAGISESDLNA